MTYKGYEFEAWKIGGTLTEYEYHKMIDILEKCSPKRICELGSGQSTLIFEKYCEKYNNVVFNSIEHDETYKRKNSIIFPLIENTEINVNGHVYGDCNKYDGFEEWLKQQNKFDFILIDGPYGYDFRLKYTYSRVQLLSFIELDKISDKAVVLYHDSERDNAKTTLNEFEKLIFERGFEYTKEVINENENRELTIYNLSKK